MEPKHPRERWEGEGGDSESSDTPAISTPNLSKLKALFRHRSNGSLKPGDEAKRGSVSTVGPGLKTGEQTLLLSGSPRGSGGLNVPLPPSAASSNETTRRTTTPTNSDPSTNPSSYSPPSQPSTALSSLSSSLTVLPHYNLDTYDSYSPSGTLKPWQCTFCLQQLSGRAAWLDHEESHMQQVCVEQGYDCAMGDDNDDWFYPCGFCPVLLRAWPERIEHISDHYDNGTTMASWDPLASPYPLYRHDFSPVRGFPACWSWGNLLAVQRVSEREGNR